MNSKNGTGYRYIIVVTPGTTLEFVATVLYGWQAIKIGIQGGWISREYIEITTE